MSAKRCKIIIKLYSYINFTIMDQRKELILRIIITEHIKTGAPVGSEVVVDKYKLNISPATVRNEMTTLENEGYIIQPYTSAGRVPTEKAYRFILDKISTDKIKKTKDKTLAKILNSGSENIFKIAAKRLAKLTGNAVFWAFHRHNLYYTGITNLFRQPEFSQLEQIYDISTVIDRLDDIIGDIFEKVPPGVNSYVGSESPFGEFSGTIIGKYKRKGHIGLFGLIGPLRMDYERNLSLMTFAYNIINK